MNTYRYATALIVGMKGDVVGAHVIEYKLPENCTSVADIPYRFVEVFDAKDIKGVENLDIVNGKIVTTHGAVSSYNKLEINDFGHMTHKSGNNLVALFMLNKTIVCTSGTNILYPLSIDMIMAMSNNGATFSNIAIDKVRKIIRPLASAGYNHIMPKVQAENDRLQVKDIDTKIAKWVFTDKARVALLDIDGTITNKDGNVPDEMVKTIRKMNAMPNTYVILSTGRILEHELSAAIGSQIVALGNGTLIFYKGKLVSSITLDIDEALKVAAYAESRGYACQSYEPERRLILQRRNSYQHDDPEAKNKNNKVILVNKHNPDNVRKTPKMLIAVDPKLTQQVKAEVESLVDTSKCNVMITTKTTVEIVPKGVDKKLSLVQICKFLGISPSEIIAVGDNNNDLPMLNNAGLSFGVANSSDPVKRSVDRVLMKPMWEGTNDLLNTLMRYYYKRVEHRAV